MSRKKWVVYEDERFEITRYGSGGRLSPKSIRISSKVFFPSFGGRTLEVTIDDLFTLTEALDDICDHIEDEEEARK